MNNKKGFTLIELLVVIAIIGILASALLVSLGGARSAARDARRISDLRQVQSAVELYSTACGHYPGTDNCNGGSPANWDALESALKTTGTKKLPRDPVGSAPHLYEYASDGSASPQEYILKAALETDNSALDNDADDNFGVICDDTQLFYCVSL